MNEDGGRRQVTYGQGQTSWARVRSVELILSTMRNLAHGRHADAPPRRVSGFEESGAVPRVWEPLAFRATDRNVGCSICV